jgi:hypothetical protein
MAENATSEIEFNKVYFLVFIIETWFYSCLLYYSLWSLIFFSFVYAESVKGMLLKIGGSYAPAIIE